MSVSERLQGMLLFFECFCKLVHTEPHLQATAQVFIARSMPLHRSSSVTTNDTSDSQPSINTDTVDFPYYMTSDAAILPEIHGSHIL